LQNGIDTFEVDVQFLVQVKNFFYLRQVLGIYKKGFVYVVTGTRPYSCSACRNDTSML
jgi:hypothetical protein